MIKILSLRDSARVQVEQAFQDAVGGELTFDQFTAVSGGGRVGWELRTEPLCVPSPTSFSSRFSAG